MKKWWGALNENAAQTDMSEEMKEAKWKQQQSTDGIETK